MMMKMVNIKEPLSEPDDTSSLRSCPDDKWVNPYLSNDHDEDGDGDDDDDIFDEGVDYKDKYDYDDN